jgi:hypothetical protein
MGLTAVLFGYAALVVFAVNLMFSNRNIDAVCLSLMMLGTWALANYFVHLGPRPGSMGPLPVLDLIGGLAAWLAWRTNRAAWKWWLIRVFLLALAVHVAFWTYYQAVPTWAPGLSEWLGENMSPMGRKFVRNLYVLGLNITTALGLLCVLWPGGSNGVVVLSGWMLRHSRRGRALGASS